MKSANLNNDRIPIKGQILKPPLQNFSRKILSLNRNKNDFRLKSQPLDFQSIHKDDARAWKWFSSAYLTRNDLRLRKLAMIIKSSKKIQELNIEFTECQKMSNHQLSEISQTIKRRSGLQKLRFGFQECPQITNEGLFSLCGGLHRRCLLESLSLCLTQSRITDKGVQGLRNCLKRLRGLKSLKLDFSECKEITDFGLKILSDGLKSMRGLESLSLSFSFCIKITNEGLQRLSEGFQKLKFPLKSLSLDFSNSGKITDEGLKSIGEALKKLVLLQKVDFKFRRCSRISGIGLQHISKGLGSLMLLKEISLDFSHQAGLGDSDLNVFSKALKGFKSLETLRIDLSGSGITDVGLSFLNETGKDIKELEINFSLCSNITDVGLQNLVRKGLANLVSLRTLGIYFRQCYHVADASLECFSGGLGKLVLLQNLKIDFASCSKITDKGFISLCVALKKLVLLENFELDFSECSQITQQGGSQLCRIVKKFGSSLKNLCWNFDKCDFLSDTELFILCKNLKNCNQLEKIKIRHGGQERNIMYYDDKQTLGWALDYTTQRLAEKGIVYHEEEEEMDDERSEKKEVIEEEKQPKEIESQKGDKKKKAACGFNLFNLLFGCFTKKRNGGQKSADIMRNNQL